MLTTPAYRSWRRGKKLDEVGIRTGSGRKVVLVHGVGCAAARLGRHSDLEVAERLLRVQTPQRNVLQGVVRDSVAAMVTEGYMVAVAVKQRPGVSLREAWNLECCAGTLSPSVAAGDGQRWASRARRCSQMSSTCTWETTYPVYCRRFARRRMGMTCVVDKKGQQVDLPLPSGRVCHPRAHAPRNLPDRRGRRI